MKTLIVVACVIALIHASQNKKSPFDVTIESMEYRNIPDKYHLGDKNTLPEGTFGELEATLKKIADEFKARSSGGTVAIVDTYADQIFSNLDQLMISNGLDPVQMPDQHSGFSYTLIITFHGELDLTRGWLYDMSSMHRGGDVVVSYSSNTKYLQVLVPIAFESLQFDYDYSAKIMDLGPTGGVHGKVSDVAVEVKIGFNTTTYVSSLDEFYITKSGHIDVSFSGNPLLDWLINLLTDVVTSLLKPLILLIVEGIIRGGLEGAIGAINDAINGFLNPTTPPGTTPVAVFLS